jgi:hypothetical protein
MGEDRLRAIEEPLCLLASEALDRMVYRAKRFLAWARKIRGEDLE